MPSRLFRLEDNVLVEVEVPEDLAEPISGDGISKMRSSLDAIYPIVEAAVRPLRRISEIKLPFPVSELEIEFGLAFEAEGNIFITKSTAKANVGLRILLKPSTIESPSPEVK